MKRILSLCILSIFLLSLTASPGFSQKAADILEKMVEALGGRKVLENIKDTTLSGSAEVMGASLTVTIYKKEPNKLRRDMDIMGTRLINAYDGEIAWSAGPFGQPPHEDAGRMAEETKASAQGDAYAALLHPEKYGITYALKGKEKIEGKEYFVLEQILPGGFKTILKTIQYVDTETYLIYKYKNIFLNSKGVEVTDESFVSDYKKVDGTMIPHSLTVPMEGQAPFKLTITKVVFNMGLEDSLFKMSK